MNRLWMVVGLGLLGVVACEDGPTEIAPLEVVRVEVSPTESWVQVNDTLWLEATPFDADGVALTTSVEWTLAGEGLGTLTPQGYRARLVAGAPGTIRVTAVSGGRSGAGRVVVQPAPPAVHSVRLTPLEFSVEEGWYTDVMAEAFTVDGHPLARPLTWESADSARATVTPLGSRWARVQGHGRGPVIIYAEAEGVRQGVELMVYPSAHPAGTVALSDSVLVMEPGRTVRMQASVWGLDGAWIDSPQVRWTSSDPTVVSVAPASAGWGELRAHGEGDVTLTAWSGGMSTTSTLRVRSALDVRSVIIMPRQPNIWLGEMVRLRAVASGAGGGTIQGAPITWQVDDPTILEIHPSGLIRGLRAGTTRVRALSGAASTIAEVRVFPSLGDELRADLLPSVGPGGGPRVIIELGTADWRDEDGIIRKVKRLLTWASIRFDWKGSAAFEHQFQVSLVLVNPDHSSRVVGYEHLVDRGLVAFDLLNPYRFHLRSTLDGEQFTAEFVDAGTLVLHQEVEDVAPLDYIYAVR